MLNASRLFIIVGTLALALTACGSDSSPTAGTPSPSDHMSTNDGEQADFGEPGKAADADRVIEIATDDSLKFSPTSTSVKLGETITFRVTGAKAEHDFTIGDEAAQTEHGDAMKDGGHNMSMNDEANAIAVPPGEVVELTWIFSKAGSFRYGCHQPGHYEAGMFGTITVA